MASSGTWLFSPNLADIVDESFERCQIDSASLTLRHITSARRSMNLMLTDWQTLGVHQWKVQKLQIAVTPGTLFYNPPANAIDVLYAYLNRNGSDTQMGQIGRTDYDAIPVKNQPGRIDRFFLDKQRDQLILRPWPVGDIAGDTIFYEAMMRFEDVGAATNTPDIPARWNEAFIADLTWRLALKFKPDRVEALKAQVWAGDTPIGALGRAIRDDVDRAPLQITCTYDEAG